ncbi:hypothetical protein BDQ17DRAFT_1337507 [Cyathus striatus]|nr:hypothetical protein BDQ17DRAFT_1337507 [Cyathus striatus]
MLGTELYGQHVTTRKYRTRTFFTHQVAKLHELHDIILSYKGDGLSLEVNRPWFSQKIKDSTIIFEGDFTATGRQFSLPPQNKPTTNETVEPDEDLLSRHRSCPTQDVVLEDETVDAETVLPKDTILSESDSPFNFRCGAAGNGLELEAKLSEAIQCSTCNDWMHLAFQQGRRGSWLAKSVKDTGIVDELWGDVNGQRAIQLGCWKLAINAPSEEDIIEDFLEAPITEEIDEVLRCHIIILEDLLNVDLQTVDLCKYRNVPALAYAHRMEKNPKERSPGYI